MPKNVEKMSTIYSPNFEARKRSKKNIKYIIFHYTGMNSDQLVIRKLTSFNSKVSCHYYVDKKGNLIQLIPDLYVAWHAGKSYWKNDKLLNNHSIGIEISNPGHEHGYKAFNNKQIKCLIKISKNLIKKYKINIKNILGHSDIAPLRKKDPGEKFPWKELASKKIGIWHSCNSGVLKKLRKDRDLKKKEREKFRKNLIKIGYCFSSKKKYFTKILKAFQMHYRKELVNGILDKECLVIAQNLSKKL